MSSPAVSAAFDLLQARGAAGATSREIADAASCLDPRDLILTLRGAGYGIATSYERTTEAGRRVYRYRLVEAA